MLKLTKIFFLSASILVLTSCASSNVARDVASNVDKGEYNAKKMGENFMDGDIAESYQNSSQMAKGALFGGAAGATIGATATYVGVIPGTLVGALFGASYGAYIDSQASLSDQLINRGATIVELGDQIMVAIPSARLFDGMSDRIKPPAYSTMNLLATYINNHTTMLVKIAAYTDDIGSRSTNVALSRQQANSVARYLTAKGVNTRLLYAEGYGGTNLVARNVDNDDAWGKSDNYRIEITMEKLQA